jgi:KDO2-lipid IV(A) lauroyltransferase
MFKIFYVFIWLLTLLPLKVLYVLSDFFYVIVYYIAKYRRKVVRANLTKSFPEKSLEDIIQIEKKFYHYFCDLFIETMYQINMSEKEILKRVKIVNADIINDFYLQNKSVMLMTAHYCNWEWLSSLTLSLSHKNSLHNIYKKLKDKSFDQFMIDIRTKYGAGVIEMQDLFKTMLHKRNEDELATYGMISDQRPAAQSIRFWMTFLNQDTPVFVGTEQLSKKFDYPVVFLAISRIKRGYYSAEVKLLESEPKNTAPNEITEKYMHMLEENIKAAPEYWLWTHNRWKYKREIIS